MGRQRRARGGSDPAMRALHWEKKIPLVSFSSRRAAGDEGDDICVRFNSLCHETSLTKWVLLCYSVTQKKRWARVCVYIYMWGGGLFSSVGFPRCSDRIVAVCSWQPAASEAIAIFWKSKVSFASICPRARAFVCCAARRLGGVQRLCPRPPEHRHIFSVYCGKGTFFFCQWWAAPHPLPLPSLPAKIKFHFIEKNKELPPYALSSPAGHRWTKVHSQILHFHASWKKTRIERTRFIPVFYFMLKWSRGVEPPL